MRKIILILITIVFCSCKTLFTENIRKNVQTPNESRIKEVQFYIDDDIEIFQESDTSDDFVEGGVIKYENDVYYNTIIFPKNTPCTVELWGDNFVYVYFEENILGKFLKFGKNPTGFGNLIFYQLNGLNLDNGFNVKYGNTNFKVIKGGQVRLLIKKKYKKKTKKNKRKIKGRKVKLN